MSSIGISEISSRYRNDPVSNGPSLKQEKSRWVMAEAMAEAEIHVQRGYHQVSCQRKWTVNINQAIQLLLQPEGRRDPQWS